MKALPLTCSLLVAAWLVTPAQAGSIFLAPGVTSEGQLTANIGYGVPWQRRWLESETGSLSGYWHAGYTWWESGRFGTDSHSFSASPVLVYIFHGQRYRPFIEAGIGAAWFSRSRVGDQRLGSRFHFEDRFGAGLEFNDGQRLFFRVIHYSNAGLKSPNQGINSWSLVYSRPL